MQLTLIVRHQYSEIYTYLKFIYRISDEEIIGIIVVGNEFAKTAIEDAKEEYGFDDFDINVNEVIKDIAHWYVVEQNSHIIQKVRRVIDSINQN
ncbi:hypothetical protein TRFO_20757 [Tritrichomonas foetus]|uniref:Uncharacterized protein n=1 Tax=Tritrichomonas foetus TaxID=1144522 RepID=A0A1J4KGP6_9EUKA|nr:hypothetical protein TRFO_20757 [Tritrichomonas foetus]|eukprot:OHT10112.1 hypothetical protein TRFO_20757 [Tritrichomonas foetus]